MNAKKKRRLAFAAALLVVGAVVAGAIVYGLGQNTMYFRSPSDVAAKQVGEGVAFRLGGLVEKGSLQLRKELLDVGTLINTIIAGFQAQCEQLDGSIQFEQAGKAVVYGDEVHLINSICNLLDNAIRYRAGAPQIRISLSSDARSITLQIADNGIGMSAETQRHIFEKFYRAHHGDVHNTRGFGLGLNYVKGIVMLHGGDIGVQSRPGKGSTFTIHLPNADESDN